MCGRYALAYPPQDIGRRLIEDGMPVDEAPNYEDVNPGYNIAPGNIEPVYRAIPDVPDPGEGGSPDGGVEDNRGGERVKYVLEPMKWGLIPSWTKRKPDHGTLLKTINCRDDSLFENKGMWTSMKHKKRCIVVAQGFYEWKKKGNDKIPHFVRRKDNKLLLMAGLWDCAQYENTSTKLYTYAIITTSANPQLFPLHTRMPVILENGSSEIRTWLSPATTWNSELQSLLKPYSSELEVYPVVKDVGNVRNNSPSFIIPLDSKDNKANIKNFFSAAAQKVGGTGVKVESGTTGDNALQKVVAEGTTPLKRERDESEGAAVDTVKVETTMDTYSPPSKLVKTEDSPGQPTPTPTPRIKSAVSNLANKRSPASPVKKKVAKGGGTPRITNFFTK